MCGVDGLDIHCRQSIRRNTCCSIQGIQGFIRAITRIVGHIAHNEFTGAGIFVTVVELHAEHIVILRHDSVGGLIIGIGGHQQIVTRHGNP